MQTRIDRVIESLPSFGCQALLIEEPVDLYYLTKQDLSLGALWISREKTELIVDSRYFESCQKNCSISVALLNEKSLPSLMNLIPSGNLGFDSAKTTYCRAEKLRTLGKEAMVDLLPIQSPLKRIRGVKTVSEIEELKRAAALNVEGYNFILSHLKCGVSEKKVMEALKIFWIEKGSESVSFDPIIAFGENGAMPHHHTGERLLQKGDSVLIDIGVTWNHYQSDMTRVVFFGEPPKKIVEIFDIVYEAQEKSLSLCRPGVSLRDLDDAARSFITKNDYGHCFSHSLGHGVGLEIHEWPIIRSVGEDAKETLEPGMVITIEPGIYVPGLGGVRIEDTILITETGYEVLTGAKKRKEDSWINP